MCIFYAQNALRLGETMLVEFKVRNFRSIRDELTLSMVATNERDLPENTYQVPGQKFSLLKTAAIFGANASGKSNLVEAMVWAKAFILGQIEAGLDESIPTDMFQFREEEYTGSSEFHLQFIHHGEVYNYGFLLTDERIMFEKLDVFTRARPRNLFFRSTDYDDVSHKWVETYKFGPGVKGAHTRLIQQSTRHNKLFLTRAAELNQPILREVLDWFKSHWSMVFGRGIVGDSLKAQLSAITSVVLEKEAELKAKALELLKVADLGIEALEIQTRNDLDPIADRLLQPEAREVWKDLYKHRVRFKHIGSDSDNHGWIALEQESHGTQKLYGLVAELLLVLQRNVCEVIDEIDGGFHPLMVRDLVKLFQGTSSAQAAPQLIFTTHDVSVLDNSLLRRDQIWFTEKDNTGNTSLVRLSDYKPRKGEALQRGYLSGRYGGIPLLDVAAFVAGGGDNEA